MRWLLTILVSLAAAEAILFATQSIRYQYDMIFGWALASLLHVAGTRFFRSAVGAAMPRFLLLSAGAIIGRLFVLIISFIIVLVGGFLRAGPFATGLLTAYFIGSWVEIALVAKPSIGGGHVESSGQLENGVNSNGEHRPGG